MIYCVETILNHRFCFSGAYGVQGFPLGGKVSVYYLLWKKEGCLWKLWKNKSSRKTPD